MFQAQQEIIATFGKTLEEETDSDFDPWLVDEKKDEQLFRVRGEMQGKNMYYNPTK